MFERPPGVALFMLRSLNNMNSAIASIEPSSSQPREDRLSSFTVKHANRVYRVYLRRDDLFFIVLAEGLSANPETLTVHLGLLGLLIGASMKKRAKKKNATATERMNQTDPEQLLSEHKRNFRLHTSEIGETSIEPRPAITFDGHQAGHWKLLKRDGKKLKFQFENNDEMTIALDALSKYFNGSLKVNVEWNAKKKKFLKKTA
jgi:hypothetical protein